MKTVAFCEIDPFCRKVLRKHWPDVPIFEDVRTLTAADVPGVDVICGGFPCQPFSHAGKQLGREDNRHLWPEYRRLVEELRPDWVVGENVVGIVNLECDNVLADLEALGYATRAFDIPACAVGAHHERRRIWIVAHSTDNQVARLRQHGGPLLPKEASIRFGGSSGVVADSSGYGCARRGSLGVGKQAGPRNDLWKTTAGGFGGQGADRCAWEPEPGLGRVAHGVPNRAHRLRSLGNAVVPQIPEIIGRAIVRCSGKQLLQQQAK